MGNDPRYNKSRCFEPFPFPNLGEGVLKQCIRDLGEQLDVHRKRQQERHPALALTGIYNVLEQLRSGEQLADRDKLIHDQGLVTILKQLHDELDAAVLEAYGWQDLLSSTPIADVIARGGAGAEALEQELLTRLVALNHDRAAEEKQGIIRWLRPDYQNPSGNAGIATPALPGTETESVGGTPGLLNGDIEVAWPEKLPDQVMVIRRIIDSKMSGGAPDPEALSSLFGRKSKKRTEQITGILETLKGLGHL